MVRGMDISLVLKIVFDLNWGYYTVYYSSLRFEQTNNLYDIQI